MLGYKPRTQKAREMHSEDRAVQRNESPRSHATIAAPITTDTDTDTDMRKFSLSLLLSLALVGCASVPMGDPKLDSSFKTFKVAPDKAGVYVYRNESMGAAVKMDIMIDGQNIGESAAKTYFYKELAPGKHTIASKAENTDTIEVDLKPGTLSFIWQEVKMGFLFARTKLHLVSEEEGKKGVLESKLAVGK